MAGSTEILLQSFTDKRNQSIQNFQPDKNISLFASDNVYNK